MLRRYSSHGLETILIQSENLTIGSDKCNVILKAEEGVHPIHASIQQNMESGLFWLRDHSLAGRTTVNGHHVDDQVELHNGDMLRFGKAQPFVFERRVVFPCKERSNFHEAVVGRNYPKLTTFPILGRKKRISQRPIPSKSPARRSATTVAQLKHYAEEVSERGKNVRGSVGNNLLQRVVRLQDELARKNHEPHLSETLSSVERNFELEAYRSLIAMVAAKVRSFNDV
uniref:FHA domain-containing protein n=1 Tax=Angiostrongylus cantonensis TaxID=6313 RepID=A0A158PAM9_ANGCA